MEGDGRPTARRADRVAAGGLTTTHTRLSVYVLWRKAGDASNLLEATSKARRSSRPGLTVGLQALYHHLLLGLVLPQVSEDLFLIWIVLTDPFQATLDPTLDVGRIQSQT